MREAHYNAFPSPDSDGKCNPGECGLTKLEYFAGLAMQAEIHNDPTQINGADVIAQTAVHVAKALLAELEKEQ